jgi:hypothetical protein
LMSWEVGGETNQGERYLQLSTPNSQFSYLGLAAN